MEDIIYLVPSTFSPTTGYRVLLHRLVTDEQATRDHAIFEVPNIQLTPAEQEALMNACRLVKIKDDTERTKQLTHLRESHSRRALARMCKLHFGDRITTELLGHMSHFASEIRVASQKDVPGRAMYAFTMPEELFDALISTAEQGFEFAAFTREGYAQQYAHYEAHIVRDMYRMFEATLDYLETNPLEGE